MNYSQKNKILDKISIIALLAIFIEIFLYWVDYCYIKRIDMVLEMPGILNVCGAIFLAISIILFLIAYKKSKKNYIYYGADFLLFAFLCPFITYWYTKGKGFFHTTNPKVLWVVLLIFYVGRVIYFCAKEYIKSKPANSKKMKKSKN